jgi:LysM domain
MGSLTAHLLEPGDHGRLPFHPSCPVCRRERLSGTLSTEPVVSRRTQAVLAGGVLAFSAGTPGFAVAAGPDRQAEGIAAPADPTVGELHDPDFDPGGETPLPFETAPAPSDTADDDGAGAPIDAEPIDDPEGRLVPPVADDGLPTDEQTAPISEEMAPTTGDGPGGVTGTPPPSIPPPPTVPPPATGDVTEPDSSQTAPRRETERRDTAKPAPRDRHLPDEPAVVQAPVPPALPAVEANPTVPVAQPTSTPAASTAAGSEGGASLRNAQRYVVQPGDSLWSIAQRLIGAEASPAKIAREVHRLWSLNEERIATGDPDLLMVGTVLRLR